MWYGQLMEEGESQLLATISPYPNMEDSCLDDPLCNNVTTSNTSSWGEDRTAAYQAAIREFKRSLLTHDDFRSILLLLLYVPVFSLAFVGNSLVLIVVILNRTMKNVTNLLLLNLAVADLSVSLVCVPIAVGEIVYKAWLFGGFMCKFATFLQGTTVTASIFTISFLSVDRYVAIKKPVLSRRIGSPKVAVKLILFVWTAAALPMIPLFLFRKVDEVSFLAESSVHFCREDWLSPLDRLIYDISVCVVVYLIPGVTIMTSYVLIGRKLWHEDVDLQRQESEISRRTSRQVMKSRKRIAKMLITLAVLFTICWLPYHITCLQIDVTYVLGGFRLSDVTHAMAVLPYTILVGHANSAINPIIYFYASRSFRRCMLKIISCKKRTDTDDDRNHVVVKYTPAMEGRRKPLVRILSSTTTGKGSKSRSTASSRFSRSTSLRSSRSFRSSGSFRWHEANGKSPMKSSLSKLKEAKAHEKKAAVPLINVAEVKSSDTANTHHEKDTGEKHRRDMFSCTLSIPTTINEESRSSRPTTPMRDMPSAIPEEDGLPEVTNHPVDRDSVDVSVEQLRFNERQRTGMESCVFIFPESCLSPPTIPLPKIQVICAEDMTTPPVAITVQSGDIPGREETPYNQKPNNEDVFESAGSRGCHYKARVIEGRDCPR